MTYFGENRKSFVAFIESDKTLSNKGANKWVERLGRYIELLTFIPSKFQNAKLMIV
ncbi:hypothetical protein PIECOFPK_01844 [Mycovorax composti]|jgi:hypothetical protein|uniref:Uncharacterized protein n=1 Tax=Mycovorax composti TaxID=2962693 RepID=A0ABZ2ELA2_9BACT